MVEGGCRRWVGGQKVCIEGGCIRWLEDGCRRWVERVGIEGGWRGRLVLEGGVGTAFGWPTEENKKCALSKNR